jgi:hypothetical protein
MFGNLVSRGDIETTGGGDDLVLGPSVFEIVEATPKRCYFSLDLEGHETEVSHRYI